MASMPNRDWRPVSVVCAECGALLKRKLFDTMTYKPIENFFCNKACKGLWQKRAKPVSRDWLFQKYAIENLDCSQIGKIVNRDPKSVWNWLVDFGIERRKRGYATIEKGFGFRKGEPSKFKGHQQKRGSDSPFWKGGITAERQAFYASAEWKAVCQIVYGRAAAQCERCGSSRRQQHRLGRRLHVHHIIPFDVKSTRALADNLAVLCRPCHLFVHSNANLIGEFIAVPVDTRRIKRGRPKGN
jgi:hypothetical protein